MLNPPGKGAGLVLNPPGKGAGLVLNPPGKGAEPYAESARKRRGALCGICQEKTRSLVRNGSENVRQDAVTE